MVSESKGKILNEANTTLQDEIEIHTLDLWTSGMYSSDMEETSYSPGVQQLCVIGRMFVSPTQSADYSAVTGLAIFQLLICLKSLFSKSKVEREVEVLALEDSLAGNKQAVQDNVFLSPDRNDWNRDPHMEDSSKQHFRVLPGDVVWKELTTWPVKHSEALIWGVLFGKEQDKNPLAKIFVKESAPGLLMSFPPRNAGEKGENMVESSNIKQVRKSVESEDASMTVRDTGSSFHLLSVLAIPAALEKPVCYKVTETGQYEREAVHQIRQGLMSENWQAGSAAAPCVQQWTCPCSVKHQSELLTRKDCMQAQSNEIWIYKDILDLRLEESIRPNIGLW
ncbi:hypothetical protein BTVI_110005 [Pitangus sulphuratus]|nr:hypothetical protein BTVI_110005 [Pitangus sulphuratus]